MDPADTIAAVALLVVPVTEALLTARDAFERIFLFHRWQQIRIPNRARGIGTRLGKPEFEPPLARVGKTIGVHALLWSLIGIALFPVFWIVVVSLTDAGLEAFLADPRDWVADASLDGYPSVWNQTQVHYWVRNSVIVSVGSTALSIGLRPLGAY